MSRFAVTLPFVKPLTEQLAKRERNFTIVVRRDETVRLRSSLVSKSEVLYSTVGTTFVFGFKEWSAVQYSGHHVRLWLLSVERCTVQWAPRSSLALKSGVPYSTVCTTFVFSFKDWSAVQYSGHHVRL